MISPSGNLPLGNNFATCSGGTTMQGMGEGRRGGGGIGAEARPMLCHNREHAAQPTAAAPESWVDPSVPSSHTNS